MQSKKSRKALAHGIILFEDNFRMHRKPEIIILKS